jgi:hypothetical protein
MDVSAYFESVTGELNALKNRVRQIIGKSHWQTDGESREAVLRNVLRRHVPSNVAVGRGFVVSAEACSPQIDILLYDAAKPVLYREGDLALVTADAVLGIIEVKSRLTARNSRQSVDQLTGALEFVRCAQAAASWNYQCATFDRPWERSEYGLIRNLPALPRRVFGALFSYETSLTAARARDLGDQLVNACEKNPSRVVDLVSCGESLFTRWWDSSNSWHTYELKNRAPGYFISNIISYLTAESVTSNQMLWFPAEGKEPFRLCMHSPDLKHPPLPGTLSGETSE